MRNFVMGLVVAAMLTGCTFGKIEPGHVGVVVPLSGDEKGTLELATNGWYMYSFNTQVYEFPTYNQQHKWVKSNDRNDRFYFGDKDGLRLGADVGIQFSIPAEKVTTLFTSYRQPLDTVRETAVKMSVQNALSRTAQDFKAEDVFGEKRSQFFDVALQKVRQDMAASGINIMHLYLVGDLELPDQIRNTIQAKLQATMIAQQKENEKRAVEAEAAKLVAKAEGDAKANVAEARGQAEARLTQARGEADALLAKAKAEAEANALLAKSLAGSILEIRKLEIQADIQKAYASKWQGHVPTTILPDQSSGFLMDMRGMTAK